MYIEGIIKVEISNVIDNVKRHQTHYIN